MQVKMEQGDTTYQYTPLNRKKILQTPLYGGRKKQIGTGTVKSELFILKEHAERSFGHFSFAFCSLLWDITHSTVVSEWWWCGPTSRGRGGRGWCWKQLDSGSDFPVGTWWHSGHILTACPSCPRAASEPQAAAQHVAGVINYSGWRHFNVSLYSCHDRALFLNRSDSHPHLINQEVIPAVTRICEANGNVFAGDRSHRKYSQHSESKPVLWSPKYLKSLQHRLLSSRLCCSVHRAVCALPSPCASSPAFICMHTLCNHSFWP